MKSVALISLCLLAWTIPAFSETPSPQVVATIIFTGQAAGELEPCGCSGRKTGGLQIRSGWVAHWQKQAPHLLLLDGGFAAPEQNQQIALKMQTYYQALQTMGYQAALLRREEWLVTMPANQRPLLLSNTRQQPGMRAFFTVALPQGQRLNVLGIDSLAACRSPQVRRCLATGTLTIVVAAGSGEKLAQALGPYPNVGCVLLADACEPWWRPKRIGGTLFCSPGKQGRYAVYLELSKDGQGKWQWQQRIITLTPQYPAIPAVTRLLEAYQQKVRKEHLLLRVPKRSSPVGFIGAAYCGRCHPGALQTWQASAHAHAMQSLVRVGSAYDPECVPCHVVGFDYVEGFLTQEHTPHLGGVGCECCHGPGARHALAGQALPRRNMRAVCQTCHQPQRSPHFQYIPYLKKIKHWRDK